MVYQIKGIYQIKTYMTPEKFNDSFVMNALSWMAFISFGFMFLGISACIVLLGVWVWVMSIPYTTDVISSAFELFLNAIFITILLVIPFIILTVVYKDLLIPESCMPVEDRHKNYDGNKGGFYYVGIPGVNKGDSLCRIAE